MTSALIAIRSRPSRSAIIRSPERLIGDTAYGAAEMLNCFVHDRGIEPHIRVFDKSQRTDGTFSREDFTYDHASDTYRCSAGKTLQHYRRQFTTTRTGVMKDSSMRYRCISPTIPYCVKPGPLIITAPLYAPNGKVHDLPWSANSRQRREFQRYTTQRI
jgi:hypothetical protein